MCVYTPCTYVWISSSLWILQGQKLSFIHYLTCIHCLANRCSRNIWCTNGWMNEWVNKWASFSLVDPDAIFMHGHKMALWLSTVYVTPATGLFQDLESSNHLEELANIHLTHQTFLVLVLKWNMKMSLFKNHEIEGGQSLKFFSLLHTDQYDSKSIYLQGREGKKTIFPKKYFSP